jgi:hypothetical protein
MRGRDSGVPPAMTALALAMASASDSPASAAGSSRHVGASAASDSSASAAGIGVASGASASRRPPVPRYDARRAARRRNRSTGQAPHAVPESEPRAPAPTPRGRCVRRGTISKKQLLRSFRFFDVLPPQGPRADLPRRTFRGPGVTSRPRPERSVQNYGVETGPEQRRPRHGARLDAPRPPASGLPRTRRVGSRMGLFPKGTRAASQRVQAWRPISRWKTGQCRKGTLRTTRSAELSRILHAEA